MGRFAGCALLTILGVRFLRHSLAGIDGKFILERLFFQTNVGFFLAYK